MGVGGAGNNQVLGYITVHQFGTKKMDIYVGKCESEFFESEHRLLAERPSWRGGLWS